MTANRIFSTVDLQQTTLAGINSEHMVYHWLSRVLIDSVVTEVQPNGDPLAAPLIDGYAARTNKLVGGLRLRLVRVRPNAECQIDSSHTGLISNCYPAYSTTAEQTAPFGNNWTYMTYAQTNELAWNGRLGFYEGGGYTIDLPANRSAIVETLASLRQARFIDRAARALFVDCNFFNGLYHEHVVARFLFEFGPGGGVLPSAYFGTLSLFLYSRPGGAVTAAIEIVLTLYVLYFIFSVRLYF